MGPLVLAPSGRSGQTHAWGCCQHVWALCHALGCTLRACFGVPTLFGRHLGIPLLQLGFWQFFAVFGQPACQFSCSVAPKGGWPLKWGAFAMPPTQNGHPKPNGARHGMGAKTPFSFKKSVEILSLFASSSHTQPCQKHTPTMIVAQIISKNSTQCLKSNARGSTHAATPCLRS